MKYKITLRDGDILGFDRVGQVIHHLGTDEYFMLLSVTSNIDEFIGKSPNFFAIQIFPAEEEK